MENLILGLWGQGEIEERESIIGLFWWLLRHGTGASESRRLTYTTGNEGKNFLRLGHYYPVMISESARR